MNLEFTQVVAENNEKQKKMCKNLTTETCVKVEGKVIERTNKNDKMATGEIEVVAKQ